MPLAAKPQKASERVVVLLKPKEKQRLEKLAKAQHISSAEVLRRSLSAYDQQDEALEKAAIVEMNTLLDGMLETLRTTREHVQKNLANIRQRRKQA